MTRLRPSPHAAAAADPPPVKPSPREGGGTRAAQQPAAVWRGLSHPLQCPSRVLWKHVSSQNEELTVPNTLCLQGPEVPAAAAAAWSGHGRIRLPGGPLRWPSCHLGMLTLWAGHLSSIQMFIDTSRCPWEPQGFEESIIRQQDDWRNPALPPNIISTFAGASKLLCKRNNLNVMVGPLRKVLRTKC